MMKSALRILITDDDEGDRKQIKRALAHTALDCECTETASIEEALEVCQHRHFDCAIVDYLLPGQNGLAGITALHELYPDMAIAMTTGHGDEMIATEAMKRGALDYIPKINVQPQSLQRVIENAMEKMQLQRLVVQQREELENFANVLVHDIKSPLTAMQAFAKFIEHWVSQGNPDRITAHCQRLIEAVGRMNALIDTLHQYTRADRDVAFETVELEGVLENMLANLQQQIDERGARITHDALPAVTGNEAQLIQLLQNLIGNGIKYCKEQRPEIHIASTSREGDMRQITVRDNGIGIPAEHVEAVFQPFRRLHGVGEYEGTGLGLATCKKIIERHGGAIWCQPEPGNGSCFFFTLPAASATTAKR